MIIDKINLNHIRIFECVYRTRSMTKAADELHMTQSGVSQHIKLLEDILEIKLFDRIKQRLIPTSLSVELFNKCSKGLYEIEQALGEIKEGEKNLSGNITVGLPIEFGNNIIVPLLAIFGKEHKRITYQITYGFASDMNKLLLSGELDFALVDEYNMDKQIKTIKIFDETLYLCAMKDYIQSKGPIKDTKKYYESLEFIDYVKDSTLVQMWFKHHFHHTPGKLNIRATMMDVQGVARMIIAGLGAGILPHHHINKLNNEGTDVLILKGNSTPLENCISLAFVEGRSRTPTINTLIEHLRNSLLNKNKK